MSKHYLPKGQGKLLNAPFWKLGVSFHLPTFVDYINENNLSNDKGYVSLTITERKQKGEFGDTHTVELYDPNSTQAELNRKLAEMSDEDKEKLLAKLAK